MSEVEKMYENAGVEPEYDYFTAIKYPKIVQYFHLNKNELVDQIVDKIKYCKKNILIKVIRVDKDYPDFTAEKQLELIKWLASRKIYEQTDYLNLGIWSAFDEYAMGIGVEPFDDRLGFDLAVKGEKFEMCLASLINNLWQDLTESDRTEIADILKG